jgi:hypothetical protein
MLLFEEILNGSLAEHEQRQALRALIAYFNPQTFFDDVISP